MITIKRISDYFRNFREFEKTTPKWQQQSNKSLRIAFLTSFSTHGFKEILTVKYLQAGVFPDVHIGGYNQYIQETLNKQSALYAFSPQMIVLFIDTASLLGDDYLFPYGNSEKHRKVWVETKIDEPISILVPIVNMLLENELIQEV